MNTHSILFVCLTLLFSSRAIAQVDCSLLDPRASVSKEREAKIQGSVGTLYKIAKADATIQGKLKDEISNLQRGEHGISEKYAIAARTIYIFCGMVANASDISTERKFQLFQILQTTIAEQSPQVKPQKPRDSTQSSPTAPEIAAPLPLPKPTTQTSTEAAEGVAAFIQNQWRCNNTWQYTRLVRHEGFDVNEFIVYFRVPAAKVIDSKQILVSYRNRNSFLRGSKFYTTTDNMTFDREYVLNLSKLDESTIVLEPFTYPAEGHGAWLYVSSAAGTQIKIKSWPLEYFSESLPESDRLIKLATTEPSKLYRRTNSPVPDTADRLGFILCDSSVADRAARTLRAAILYAKGS